MKKNPELLKQSGWINSHARTLNNSIRDRNKYLENAQSASIHSGLNVHQLDNTLKMQAGIANAECVSALQLFDSLLITAQSLESINATYTIDVKKTKLTLPDTLAEAMNQLKEIKESILQLEVKQP